MAKLKVDEIEATSTNTNVKVSPKGTGVLEVQGTGGNDATVQLNCSAQSHGVKIKPPANSTGQNYTMILPDNQVAQNKLLKVKSITGSGATAVGQLEYSDVPAPNLSSLNASNITTGNVPAARFGSTGAMSGGGLSLVQKTTLSADASTISFTGLADNRVYRLIAKNLKYSPGSNNFATLYFLDSNGSTYSNYQYQRIYELQTNGDLRTQFLIYLNMTHDNRHGPGQAVIMDFQTKADNNWYFLRSFHQQDYQNRTEIWGTTQAGYSYRYHGVQFNGQFKSGTEVLLYEYLD